jgi:DNA helicase HerA-like ATPase
VVLDESHRYAPNFGQVESSEALIHLATSGRKRGFGAIFATQRLSQLSKAKRR